MRLYKIFVGGLNSTGKTTAMNTLTQIGKKNRRL